MPPSNQFTSWGDALRDSFGSMISTIANWLPTVLGAVIVLILGILVAQLLGKLVSKGLSRLRLDALAERAGVRDDFERLGLKGKISGFLGSATKWLLILVTLFAVVDILQIEQLSEFFAALLGYIPEVIIAVIILAVGVVSGRFLQRVVERSMGQSSLMSGAARPIARVAKWSVMVFALMAALVELGVAATLIQILFAGLVVMVAIAGGLAFGLGGRDKAHDWLDQLDRGVRGGRSS